MNRQIRRLGIGFLVLYAVLFGRLNMIQVFAADELTADPLNTRRIVRDFGQRRGQILTTDGTVVAESVETDGRFARRRSYPHGPLYAGVTGYFSFEFGATGVERSANDALAGRTDQQRFDSFFDFFGDGDVSGDVWLTIDSELQAVAADRLGSRRGSVVALDPRTGAVLALYSWPTFDPNLISTVDLEAARAAKQALDVDPANPLLTRAHRELYPPGSTFKVITAAAALETGRATPELPVYPETTEYRLPLTQVDLSNYGGLSCGGDLAESLARSCNTVFAELAAEHLGPDLMVAAAEGFGFNTQLPFDLPLAVSSRFPTDYGDFVLASEASPQTPIVAGSSLLAQAGIGQYDVAASPLQMALVAAAVANDGKMMKPHVVSHTVDTDDQGRLDTTQPSRWRQALPADTAAQTRDLMIGVVETGTATGLARPGLAVGAKTGTAEVTLDVAQPGTGDTHAWMIAFAGPRDGPAELAIAVMVEAVPGAGQQTGGAVAGPIAAALIDANFG